MDAKPWMLAYADGDVGQGLAAYPDIDRARTAQEATRLFPEAKLTPLDDGSLTWSCPPRGEVHIGCFEGVTIAAAREFGIYRPSKLNLLCPKNPEDLITSSSVPAVSRSERISAGIPYPSTTARLRAEQHRTHHATTSISECLGAVPYRQRRAAAPVGGR